MLSGGEWWVVGLGMVFVIADLRFLPDAFTSTINAVDVYHNRHRHNNG